MLTSSLCPRCLGRALPPHVCHLVLFRALGERRQFGWTPGQVRRARSSFFIFLNVLFFVNRLCSAVQRLYLGTIKQQKGKNDTKTIVERRERGRRRTRGKLCQFACCTAGSVIVEIPVIVVHRCISMAAHEKCTTTKMSTVEIGKDDGKSTGDQFKDCGTYPVLPGRPKGI